MSGRDTVVVTGGAGFIGSHLCQRLLDTGRRVVLVDSFDDFYDPAVKRANVAALAPAGELRVVEADIRDAAGLLDGLRTAGAGGAAAVVHLAARAGVRPSIQDPLLYSDVNVSGTVAVLEAARHLSIPSFVFGSSSSVYGDNPKVPFAETDPVDHPISPYAATKRAGELLCHSYAHLFGLSVVCLRFFTVYGPRQRPDLAIHKFARLIAAGEAIPLFGAGDSRRDYTYVDDIVHGVEGALRHAAGHPGDFQIVNLGESDTVSLSRLVRLLGESLGTEPLVQRLPPQPGDVQQTYADITRARELLGYQPRVCIDEGITRFVEWFRRQPVTA